MSSRKITEFQRIANAKGWTLIEVAQRWDLSERQMSRIAKSAKQRDIDAVTGLPENKFKQQENQ